MAKRSSRKGPAAASTLPGLNLAGSLRLRKHDTLFLPRLLEEEGRKVSHAGKEQDEAYAILLKWAEQETGGHLARYKETSANADFLNDIFGKALGYKTKADDPTDFGIDREYTVPGVGAADGALGLFPNARSPVAIIELKSADTDLDRDKTNGRTPVQQAWDYLNALPDCPWAIVSNFSTIRLYHRNKTQRAYEEFTLQQLRDRETFNQFYALLKRRSLLHAVPGHKPLTIALLEKTGERQKQVGDSLYNSYRDQRNRLIAHLVHDHGKPLDTAIHIAQKLLDRVIFIAFCEDRGLLPRDTLDRAWSSIPAFSKVTNPRWQNFIGLFHLVDKGGKEVDLDVGFNGGLFRHDPEVDDLQLDDAPWTNALKGFGEYDFAQEVNVEVLGHLFERSITELEKLRVGGLFALTQGEEAANGAGGNGKAPAMKKSAQRKRMGIYYTPPAFTGLLVSRTVDALVEERFAAHARAHKVDRDTGKNARNQVVAAYWRDCLATLRDLKIVDPACGSGAFLIRAYDALESHYTEVVGHLILAEKMRENDARSLRDSIPDWILSDNLYGVDLSAEGVEITQLALWIRSARRGRTLADLSRNIIRGNSLVRDPAVHPLAFDWKTAFPHVFDRGGDRAGFDCVIGNPPWERVKVQEREFFSITDPATAGAVSAAERRRRIAAMPKANPELFAAYEKARESAARMLAYARRCGDYPLTGKGDVNLYMLFAELARTIVAPAGLVGLLVPSGIATDDTTKDFFNALMEAKSLVSLYDFENRERIFPDVHGCFKFSAIVFGGSARKTPNADFVFFAHSVEEVEPVNKKRHIALTAADMRLLNPNTRTCPIFRTRRDADLTKSIYKRVPILIDANRTDGGNPWGITFCRMFDQTNDAEHFKPAKHWEGKGYKLRGNVYTHGKKSALPLYEAKMVQAFDHRAASVLVEKDNWVRQGQKNETTLVQHANPEFAVLPRWWVDDATVQDVSGSRRRDWLLAYKDVTSATNERTMIASFLPWVAVVNSAPLVFIGDAIKPRRECCLLANLNSFVYDFIARQKVGSVHLNFFIVEQLPTLPPDAYDAKCPWSGRETLEHWISERVLKLSCTAEDMIPLAAACGFKGSRGDGVHIWKEQERARLRAELDAAFFHLYGVERDDASYMLSTFSHTGYVPPAQRGPGNPEWAKGSIGEAVLEAYDALASAS